MQNRKKLSGAAAKQIFLGEENKLNILFALGKFGWLSQSQLAKYCKTSVQTIRHVLRRMMNDKLIWTETYNDSPGVKAFALTRKGASLLKKGNQGDSLEKVSTFYKSRGFLSNFEHQYHRHLANEFLIALQSEQIEFGNHIINFIKSEHEIQAMKNTANTIFQCIPDILAITTDMTLLIIEIENSSRGISQHKGSLTHWLEVFAEKYQKEDCYSDSLRDLFRELVSTDENGNIVYPEFDNVEQIFVCRNEVIFRNIWRKVERVTAAYPTCRENISYFVLPKKQHWHNIFFGIEPRFHDELETRELVIQGSERHKYTADRRQQIVEQLNATGASRSLLAKQHNMSVSTLDRWRREFLRSI
ncbi:hypothetical protein AMBAS45_16385 [Alteromonas macleodii str. 'Balearic Sea AD45']|uniref:transposase n=1 Tax=Alteromonas macleodii TaxID=28108 RepID=UPI000286FE04|nr:transposase [Alteromonas macleodii]AFT96738.1 hypothetical protein AMBAS45_16385 [Alteromonas macleodii str. 'Balearic Sea AD45']